MSSKGDLMIGNEAVRGSPDADELLGATFDETELTQMAVTDADWLSVQVTEEELKSMAPDIDDLLTMTDADWMRLRLPQEALIQVRGDLIRRLGVSAQELTWLNRAIESGKHGHKGAQTGADRTQTAQR